jgi:hypothetical protein
VKERHKGRKNKSGLKKGWMKRQKDEGKERKKGGSFSQMCDPAPYENGAQRAAILCIWQRQ